MIFMNPSRYHSPGHSAKLGPKEPGFSLLHPAGDAAFDKLLSRLSSESRNLGGDTPKISSILKWMGQNLRVGVEGGFLRKKLIRSDVEILNDREANWIEYCVLFYSLARRLGIECCFGVFERPGSDLLSEEGYCIYHIFAKEGERTAIISPFSGDIVRPKEKLAQKIDAAEFFRRISILSKVSLFSVLHTAPLLYYLYGDVALWLYRPEPDVLLQTFAGADGPVLGLRCIFVKSMPQHFDFTLFDHMHALIFTTSHSELMKFSAKPPAGFKVSSLEGKDAVFKLVRALVGRKYSGVMLGRNMQKLLAAFAKDAKGQYDPAYA